MHNDLPIRRKQPEIQQHAAGHVRALLLLLVFLHRSLVHEARDPVDPARGRGLLVHLAATLGASAESRVDGHPAVQNSCAYVTIHRRQGQFVVNRDGVV